MKRNKVIVANWKLNPETPREAKELFGLIKKKISNIKKTSVVICPPLVFLPLLEMSKSKNKNLYFGGQDGFYENNGSHTGEISSSMVKYSGAKYVILGHSERRALGDDNEIVNLKVKKAIKNGLFVILCVGEKERDDRGDYLEFLKKQVKESLLGVPTKEYKKIMIAYEPVWAIGDQAKSSDTPSAFLHNALYLKKVLSGIIGQKPAFELPILYGGSVNKNNAESFLVEGEADGLLIGRASLSATEFSEIVKIADNL